jgi:predicted negative regulator of RcsB-dependent stress response
MDIYASDDEKAEDIKRWWRENGRSVIAGSILGLAIIFSSRYWFEYQQDKVESAANYYQQVTQLIAEDTLDNVLEKHTVLLNNYSSTPYAVFSALEVANQALINDDTTAAKTNLEWVMNNAKLAGHVEIARLRLARLFVIEENYEQALALINQSTVISFASLFSELKGDIYAKQNQYRDARAAYQSAILSHTEGDARYALLNMKIDNMAVIDES